VQAERGDERTVRLAVSRDEFWLLRAALRESLEAFYNHRREWQIRTGFTWEEAEALIDDFQRVRPLARELGEK
jgi:hypothetical protein